MIEKYLSSEGSEFLLRFSKPQVEGSVGGRRTRKVGLSISSSEIFADLPLAVMIIGSNSVKDFISLGVSSLAPILLTIN